MNGEMKRGYQAIAIVLLYGLLWSRCWSLSDAAIYHWLLVGALSAPFIAWPIFLNRTKKQGQLVSSTCGDQTRILIDRNQTVIGKYSSQISLSTEKYYIQDLVRDCIQEIARAEKRSELAPGSQWLWQWRRRTDLPADYRGLANHLVDIFQQQYDRLRKQDALAEQILRRNRHLIDKFCEIAERKVSLLDPYGDENWDALPGAILLCMKKIARRERGAVDWNEYCSAKRRIKRDPRSVPPTTEDRYLKPVISTECQLIETKLELAFREYHDARKARSPQEIDIDALSGTEFQTYFANTLRSDGYEVTGTPASGDQGADLLAKKDGRLLAVQTKRTKDPVGNKAVQAVLGAVPYYGASDGWVATNSTFTPSAIALAQRANVKLIDGLALRTKSFLRRGPEPSGETPDPGPSCEKRGRLI